MREARHWGRCRGRVTLRGFAFNFIGYSTSAASGESWIGELVAMSEKGQMRTDELSAVHMRKLLEGRTGNGSAVRDAILAGARIADFNNPA